MLIAGDTRGRQGDEIEYVRSVTLVSRWIHEMFEPIREQVSKGGGPASDPRGRTDSTK